MCVSVSVIKTQSFGRFWPLLGLLLIVLGPRVISTIDEPRGAFMFRSSTLTFFADSGTFRVLLLTVLGSRSDFHD